MNIPLAVKWPNGNAEQSCAFSDHVKNSNQATGFPLVTKPEHSALKILKPATGHIFVNFRWNIMIQHKNTELCWRWRINNIARQSELQRRDITTKFNTNKPFASKVLRVEKRSHKALLYLSMFSKFWSYMFINLSAHEDEVKLPERLWLYLEATGLFGCVLHEIRRTGFLQMKCFRNKITIKENNLCMKLKCAYQINK
jgi:hypothetical protein